MSPDSAADLVSLNLAGNQLEECAQFDLHRLHHLSFLSLASNCLSSLDFAGKTLPTFVETRT